MEQTVTLDPPARTAAATQTLTGPSSSVQAPVEPGPTGSQQDTLRQEQAYIDECYDCLDRGLAEREHSFSEFRASDLVTRRAMGRALEILRQSRGSGQLVFGRFDADGTALYVGRRRVYDDDADLKVVGWHAPAAQRFYESTSGEPLGLTLKRVFSEEDRKLKRVFDEIAATVAADTSIPPRVSDALVNELERSRDVSGAALSGADSQRYLA